MNGEDRGRSTDNELTRQEEDDLPVLDLAAVGIVNSAWRNSPVEDWHAGGGPLTDVAMLRLNARTTWRVREIVRRWLLELGMAPEWPAAALDDLDVEETDLLAVRIWRWLVRPTRRLPIRVTPAELADDGLHEYGDHADTALGSFAGTAERRGARYALWRAATHGGLALSSLVGHAGMAAAGRVVRGGARRSRTRPLRATRCVAGWAGAGTGAGG